MPLSPHGARFPKEAIEYAHEAQLTLEWNRFHEGLRGSEKPVPLTTGRPLFFEFRTQSTISTGSDDTPFGKLSGSSLGASSRSTL